MDKNLKVFFRNLGELFHATEYLAFFSLLKDRGRASGRVTGFSKQVILCVGQFSLADPGAFFADQCQGNGYFHVR